MSRFVSVCWRFGARLETKQNLIILKNMMEEERGGRAWLLLYHRVSRFFTINFFFCTYTFFYNVIADWSSEWSMCCIYEYVYIKVSCVPYSSYINVWEVLTKYHCTQVKTIIYYILVVVNKIREWKNIKW